MKTVSAKKLSAAIDKARGVGLVEERVTIGECEFVLRSLRPDEYDSIIEDTKGFEDIAYVHAYQKGHVCRAIVELNGIDLRETRFVEDEEDDPKKPGQTRTVNLELHDWVNKRILSTWGREAILVAYRKLGEIVVEAEKKAKEGITFRTPDETDEEKFRRLLGEAREAAEDLPPDLAVRVLGEFGYQHATTEEEVKAAAERLASVEPMPEEAPVVEPEAPPEPFPAPLSPEEVMRARTPLNRVAEGRVPQVLNTPPVDLESAARPQRTAQIADLEGDPALAPAPPPTAVLPPPTRPSEVATLERKAPVLDPRAAAAIIEKPPTGGINPRYRPPQRP